MFLILTNFRNVKFSTVENGRFPSTTRWSHLPMALVSSDQYVCSLGTTPSTVLVIHMLAQICVARTTTLLSSHDNSTCLANLYSGSSESILQKRATQSGIFLFASFFLAELS